MLYYFLILAVSLILTLILGGPLIDFLRTLKAKQTIREDGPARHINEKANTPTIGGLIFLIPFFLISIGLLTINETLRSANIYVILGTTFILFLLGFIDDYLKILKKHNKGISGWIKLAIQLALSIIIFFIYSEDKSIFSLIWIFFVIAGASNSYNLTDGLDGLVTSISILTFFGFFSICLIKNMPELATLCIVFSGVLLGFLYFNKYPAKIFMGDTGSLAIGGAVGAISVASKSELLLMILATIPILEALSVILQVFSCQISKKILGKDLRIFKMAPLHHHFELIGWTETQIVNRFFLFQAIIIVFGIAIIKAYL